MAWWGDKIDGGVGACGKHDLGVVLSRVEWGQRGDHVAGDLHRV